MSASDNGLTSDADRLTSREDEAHEKRQAQERIRNLRARRELIEAKQRSDAAATHVGKPQWMGGK